MSRIFGTTAAGIVIIVLIVLVLVLMLLVITMNMRLNRLMHRYRIFMRGQDGQSVERSIASKIKDIDRLQAKQTSNTELLGTMRKQFDRTLNKYGIVKYDAFEDVGGKMSFALAMLDVDDNGFVLNAIHSRDNCFLYLKEVVKGESYIMLSEEEVQALRAASAVGVEDIE